jgi:beta-glucosidase
VVQLYVRDEESRLVRPLQELKAFAKVALEPGETKTVTLTLTGNRWLITIRPQAAGLLSRATLPSLVGSSSRDIRLTAVLTWVGETALAIETPPTRASYPA